MGSRNWRRCAAVLFIGLATAGCGPTWSSAEISPSTTGTATGTATARAPKSPAQVTLTEGDVSARRKYIDLGEISVTVNKTTIFHPDPTRELVNQALREEAAKLGADAVTQVRYGTVGISFLSWGSLDGRGRAIAYTN